MQAKLVIKKDGDPTPAAIVELTGRPDIVQGLVDAAKKIAKEQEMVVE